jgi:uncharacterized protein with GYD domain
MKHYLLRVSFNSQGWAAWIAQPHSCKGKIQAEAESLGGRLLSMWWAFGEDHVFLIFEMPDDVIMSAFSIFAVSMGAMQSFTITPIMTDEEALQAMKKAGALGAGSGAR